jgi:hypothetical protein
MPLPCAISDLITSGSLQPTRGSAVPKFGDWDSNPASADGYTLIFNKVREEKQSQPGKPAAYGNGGKQHDDGDVSSVSGAARPENNNSGFSGLFLSLLARSAAILIWSLLLYLHSQKFSCFGWCK